ncbi:hypothetical protein HUA74_43980 [Myxococcus sp. CA051A]|uniref:hypothetical protein n=1 Tax=Myxococcus sp. CA051A TaxID=2741739 RepID=UPI00157A645A|nr:hypothetical protein [Myxococcus sp. CA051A]NTX67629.1 hypothetical protein [Myxococcus sp. CA051A]
MVVTDPTAFVETIRQSIMMAEQVEQARQTITTAKENLELARDVYAGINEIAAFDPDEYLQQARDSLGQQLPIAHESNALRSSLQQGLRGGTFDASSIARRMDIYGDRARRQFEGYDEPTPGQPYNYAGALSAAKDLQRVAENTSFQTEAGKRPPVATAADGLLMEQALQQDPQLVVLLSQRRAEATAVQRRGTELYMEALGASPGKAQQLAAQSSAQSLSELALINEHLAHQEARQQLQDLKAAQEEAAERRSLDTFGKTLDLATQRAFTPRVKPPPPSLNLR